MEQKTNDLSFDFLLREKGVDDDHTTRILLSLGIETAGDLNTKTFEELLQAGFNHIQARKLEEISQQICSFDQGHVQRIVDKKMINRALKKTTPEVLSVSTTSEISDDIELASSKNNATHGGGVLEEKVLSFNVSFEVKDRVLVDNAFADIKSGECLAIMGPSGAGKTTLLNVLTYEAKGGVSSGVIRLNGIDMSEELFQQRCSVVTQEDHHWAFLTTKETLTYAAKLYLIHLTKDEIENKVNEMMKNTGLEICSHTKVGNTFLKGLSGGQKRRLSVAVALLKNLDVLYLDEPTSGLDSASAAAIMTFLSDVALKHNLISLTTIHQPSTAVYHRFDRVMILSRGKMAYCGKAGNYALDYLSSIGHPIPPNTNPAEFMVDLVNGDFNDVKIVNHILDSWSFTHKNHQIADYPSSSSSSSLKLNAKNTQSQRGSICQQIQVLLQRHFILAYRDPLLYVGRMIVFTFATLFFAIVYYKTRSLEQDQVLTRMWYLAWCIGMPANMGVIAVFAYNLEFFAVRREVKNGMISPLAYLIATSILQFPMMILFGIFSISIGGYGVLKCEISHYFQILIIYSLTMYTYESKAQVFSVLFQNPLLGMLNFVQVWFGSFLFCGIMVPIKDVIWPINIFGYILPLKYGLSSIVYEEFIDQNWKGAETCNPNSNSNENYCFHIKGYNGEHDGYTCGNLISSGDVCYGAKGWQVLEQLNKLFESLNSDDLFYENVLILSIMVFVLKCIHTYLSISNCYTHMKLIPTNKKQENTKNVQD
mmetsp:Transcript_11266/g.14548  ORF Transcript_11266/g.14548 Transcript_11266/m.14548 type:complete len:764 (-) Transcript_11266:453-2744(-)